MERRVLLVRTTSQNSLTAEYKKTVEDQVTEVVQSCYLGILKSKTQLTSSRILIGPLGRDDAEWTAVQGNKDIKDKLVSCYTFSQDSLADLSEGLHRTLDQLGSPGTFNLDIVWLCDNIPDDFVGELYSSLRRAVCWHGAAILIITQEAPNSGSFYDSLTTLRANVVSLKECRQSLSTHFRPHLVWRGSLAFYDEEALDYLTLPGFEIHLDRDLLDQVLDEYSLTQCGLKSSGARAASGGDGGDAAAAGGARLHFSDKLEVVTQTDARSVGPHLLTREKLLVGASLTGEDEDNCLVEEFLADGFPDASSAMVMRLRYSTDPPAGSLSRLSGSSQWAEHVRRCDAVAVGPPFDQLGQNLGTISLLVYSDPARPSDGGNRMLIKSATVLKSCAEVKFPTANRSAVSDAGRQLSRREAAEEQARLVPVRFELDVAKATALRHFVRQVQAEVFSNLMQNKSELLANNSVEDLLTVIQEELLKNFDVHRQTDNDVEGLLQSLAIGEQGEELFPNPDDWPEKRYLEFVDRHEKRLEQARNPVKQDGLVVLEAKRILNYFTKIGSPLKPSQLEAISVRHMPVRNGPSQAEYEKLMKQNFKKVSDDYSGYKYRGGDFRQFESVPWHGVHYNTGDTAEERDRECKRLQQVYISHNKETASTVVSTLEADRLKVHARKKSQHKSPRKSPKSPRKRVLYGKNSSISSRRNPTKTSSMAGLRQATSRSARLLESSTAGHARTAVHQPAAAKPEAQQKPRRSGETTAANDDMEHEQKMKLRNAVYDSLGGQGIDESHPLFRPCFRKLFQICKMFCTQVPDKRVGSVRRWMTEVANKNVESVVALEQQMRN